jgi:hypothetical protein
MRFRSVILVLASLLWTTPVLGQGCSMCVGSAKATSQQGQRAISRAVLILLVPPVGFMTLGVWAAFRYGKKRDLEHCESS